MSTEKRTQHAREQAEKRLHGAMDGSDWAKADGIKGVGWALLVLADSLSSAITGAADRVAEALVQSAGAPSPTGAQTAKQRLIERAAQEEARGTCPECAQGKHINCTEQVLAGDHLIACRCMTAGHQS